MFNTNQIKSKKEQKTQHVFHSQTITKSLVLQTNLHKHIKIIWSTSNRIIDMNELAFVCENLAISITAFQHSLNRGDEDRNSRTADSPKHNGCFVLVLLRHTLNQLDDFTTIFFGKTHFEGDGLQISL